MKGFVERESQDLTLLTTDKKHTHHKNTIQQSGENCGTLGLEMKPIGCIESCFKEKNGIPRQPSICPTSKANLSINIEGFTNPEHSLLGLEKFSHVWIIFHFHKNTNKNVKAKVKPPRLDGAKVGVFASRSPHRPNPIGLTLAKLNGIIGNTLLLSGIDLLDGTPVLDIKPYVPDYDEAPEISCKDNLDRDIRKEQCENEVISSLKFQGNGDDHCLANSVDAKPVNRTNDSRNLSRLEPKTQTNHVSVAEWIHKPPIRELNVKFCTEALEQIDLFHGTMLDRDTADVVDTACKCGASSEMASGMNVDNSANGEPEGSSENRVAGELTCRYHKLLKSVFDESDEETKIVHVGEKASNPQSFEWDTSVGSGSSIKSVKVCDDLKLERFTSLSPCKELQMSGKCIYQLKMFSSSDEAKRAIIDVLKADPRSVYRRNHCQGQLYRFSIDSMNVTCKFYDFTAEVLQVEPVYYRKVYAD